MNRLGSTRFAALLAGAVLAASGCKVLDTSVEKPNATPTPSPTPQFSNETYASALRVASLRLRGRLPTAADTANVTENGQTAYDAIVDRYLDRTQNPDLVPQLKAFYSSIFLMAGTVNGIDYDAPVNLATYLVVNERPVTEILSAEYCVDGAMNQATCVDGAPDGQRAGVIGQKGFLAKFGQADTVNMRRVSVVHQLFACGIYPDGKDTNPSLVRTNVAQTLWPPNPDLNNVPDPSLVPYADDPASPPRLAKKYQTKLPGDSGAECSMCHSSLNARRPVFTPYDVDGVYDATRTIANNPGDGNEGKMVESPDVNGNQDYCGVLGDTDGADGDANDDMDPNAADCVNGGKPPANYLGLEMATLKDFGAAIMNRTVSGERFYECMATRHYNFVLGKSQGVLGLQAAGGTTPSTVASSILSKYKQVYEVSDWNSLALLRAVFKGEEFLSSQQN